MDKINEIEKSIKSLSIQGATNIALATLDGIRIASRIQVRISPYVYLRNVAERLAYVRPTEPLAQNAVRFIFSEKNRSLEYYLGKTEEYFSLIEKAKQKMGENAAEFIQNGGVYLTHCHSSTVVSMFRQAKKTGKRFSVYATETRPLFQGRITVKDLLRAGIKDVTLIIDDVAYSILEQKTKRIDGVFIGADLLSQTGFVNKVGSLGIACAAKRRKIPLYCLSILLKYDPRPYHPSILETRSGDEIWAGSPRNLKFYAPAFDFIPYEAGTIIITEKGKISGSDIAKKAKLLYSFLN